MDDYEITENNCIQCNEELRRAEGSSESSVRCEQNQYLCEKCVELYSEDKGKLMRRKQQLRKLIGTMEREDFSQSFAYKQIKMKGIQKTSMGTLKKDEQSLLAQLSNLQAQILKISQQSEHLIRQYSNICFTLEQNFKIVSKRQAEYLNQFRQSHNLDVQKQELSKSQNQLSCLHILSQIFTITFEDNTAFINQFPIDFHNSYLVCELMLYLLEKEELYVENIGIDIENKIIRVLNNNTTININCSSEAESAIWLNQIARELYHFWIFIKENKIKHMKYYLPVTFSQEQYTVVIQGHSFNNISQYKLALKYLIQVFKRLLNLQYLIMMESQ